MVIAELEFVATPSLTLNKMPFFFQIIIIKLIVFVCYH